MSYYSIENGRIYKRNAGFELFIEHPIYTTVVLVIVAAVIMLIGGARGWFPFTLLGVGIGVLLLTIAYDVFDPLTPQAEKDAKKAKEVAEEERFKKQMEEINRFNF